MTSEQSSPLSKKIKEVRERAHAQADTTITELVKIATWLDLRETAEGLTATGKLLADYTFNLMVMGRMKNGKSTLLNALLEGTTRPVAMTDGRGLMAVGTRPTTAVLTTVHYADNPSVRVIRMDGSEEPWNFPQYLRNSVLTADNEENKRIFEQIKEFKIGYPAMLCQEGVIVVDSPGTDEHPMRTQVTLDALRRADAVIRPYRSDVFVGENELAEDSEVRESGTRVFTVVNLWDDAEADDELRAWVWNRYVHDHLGGPKWAGQDHADYDVYFANGKKAFTARQNGDIGGVERSGLAVLERRLGDFLAEERFPAHLRKHATSAIRQAGAIDEHISQREAAVQADQRQLHDAYLAEQPKITQIQARGDKLPAIFARYQAQAELDLRSSFRQAVADIRRDLPEHMATVQLPPTGMTAVLKHKKLAEAASQAISGFATARLDQWARTEAPKLLEPIRKRLSDEVAAEVASISDQLDEVNFRMSGWTVETGGNIRLVGTTERVLSAVAGLFFGDISAAVTGGAGGWRGAVGGISGALGASFILGALGVGVGSIVFWPATLAAAALAGLTIGGLHIEERAKKAALETADPALAMLPDTSGDLIATKTAEFFGRAEEQVTAEVRGYIAEQIRSIEKFVELNQRDQADKDRALKELAQAREAVKAHTTALEQAIAVAKQG
jgi:Dynamin family